MAEILTAAEIAAEIRCSKPQVYRLMNGVVQGVPPLPYISLGRKKVVRRSTLESWIRANEMNSDIVAADSEVNAVDALKLRKRYQNGTVKKSANGRYWIGQWREDGTDGKRHERTTVLGKVAKMTKSQARKEMGKIVKPIK